MSPSRWLAGTADHTSGVDYLYCELVTEENKAGKLFQFSSIDFMEIRRVTSRAQYRCGLVTSHRVQKGLDSNRSAPVTCHRTEGWPTWLSVCKKALIPFLFLMNFRYISIWRLWPQLHTLLHMKQPGGHTRVSTQERFYQFILHNSQLYS